MSNYPNPYGDQNYPNYPANQPPGASGYPPQYSQQQPQGQYQGYPGQPQPQPQPPQPPPQPFGYPQPQPHPTYGQHAQYTPIYPSRDVMNMNFPSASAPPPHTNPRLNYPVPQDPSAPRPPPNAPPGPPQVPFWSQQQVPSVQPRQLTDAQAREAAATIFERFDVDNGGYLDLQEFMDALRALHLAITYQEAMECFIRSDANEDGRIGKDEFINIYVEEMKKRRY